MGSRSKMARTRSPVAPPRLSVPPTLPPRAEDWQVTFLLVAAGAALMLLMTVPAFHSYFFGEDFMYVGQYRAHGDDFWRAVFSPTDNIFFRPVFCAVNLLTQFVLPLDPFVHHIRNWLVSAVNVLLLYRILLRLVTHRFARVAGIAFFVISKVHFTTIGYINVFDSIVSLLLLLATVLCFLRFAAEHRARDYVLALVCCFLSIFTKDYGLVVVAVVAALVASRSLARRDWRSCWRWWAIRLAPLPVMVALYLALRQAIVGLVPTNNAAYSPQLALDVSAWKVAIFLGTLGNLSLDPGTTGGSGLGGWTASHLLGSSVWATVGEALLFAPLVALLATTLWAGRGARWRLLLPLVWIAAYFGPTLITRNIQMYYLYEVLAGAAVLLALCLDQADRRLRAAWAAALLVIALNGLVSNYTSLYTWQFVANAAQQVQQPLLVAHHGEPLQSVTFITRSRPFWEWTLTKDGKGPMVPELLHRPDLQVRFLDYADLPAHAAEADATHLFFDIDNGFVAYQPGQPRPPLVLQTVTPAEVTAGAGFNVQPNGESALAVSAEGATRGTSVVLAGQRLATPHGTAEYRTALVPPDLLRQPGRYPVYLDNGIDRSNRLDLVVRPEAGATP